MMSLICCHISHIGCEDVAHLILSCHCLMSFFVMFCRHKFKRRSHFQYSLTVFGIECTASVISKSIIICIYYIYSFFFCILPAIKPLLICRLLEVTVVAHRSFPYHGSQHQLKDPPWWLTLIRTLFED